MSTPELLRETLREVLYGPPTFGLGQFELGHCEPTGGLPGEGGAGLLHTTHAFTPAQALAPAASGRPSAAQVVVQLRQHLEHVTAQLHDPYALRPDEPDAWELTLTPERWSAERLRLAQAGQALYDALYLPLDAGGWRVAHGGVMQAVYHAGALHVQLRTVQAGA